MEWISVDASLPHDKLVLIYAPLVTAMGYFENDKWYIWGGLGRGKDLEIRGVTHWMEKPKRPKQ